MVTFEMKLEFSLLDAWMDPMYVDTINRSVSAILFKHVLKKPAIDRRVLIS